MAGIDVKEETIGDLLNKFFVIPSFQRQYVWEEKNVEQLFNDINVHYQETLNDGSGENYFLGSIISYSPDRDIPDRIIDGQQRLTTLSIFLAVIRDFLKPTNEEFPGYAKSMLQAEDADEDGRAVPRERVEIHYPDGSRFMKALIKEKGLVDQGSGDSLMRLNNAYSTLRRLVEGTFADNPSNILKFLNHIRQRVSVIHVRTSSFATCFKLFETINARGVGLSASDLVKNFIFSKVRPADHENLDKKWQDILSRFGGSTKDFVQFFKDYTLSRRDISDVNDDKILDIYQKHKDSFSLIDELLDSSLKYNYFLDFNDHENCKNDALFRIDYIGKRYRIHLSLLLAAAHFCPDHWDEVVDCVERYVVVSKALRRTQPEVRDTLAKWRMLIVRSEGQNINEVIERLNSEIKKDKSEFEQVILGDNANKIGKGVRRYLLARLYAHFEQKAYRTGALSFNNLLGKEFEEEHCLPQTYNEHAASEFGVDETEYQSWVWKFGNLILIEKSLNGSCQNKEFSRKKVHYEDSRLVLTKKIVKDISLSSNNSISKASIVANTYDNWNAMSVSERGRMYATELSRILGLSDNLECDFDENGNQFKLF